MRSQIRGIPVARTTAARLPHVWVDNVTNRKKHVVEEFHLVKSIHSSLDKQFDSALPEIYKYKKKPKPKNTHRLTLEYISAEDRNMAKVEYRNNEHFGSFLLNSTRREGEIGRSQREGKKEGGKKKKSGKRKTVEDFKKQVGKDLFKTPMDFSRMSLPSPHHLAPPAPAPKNSESVNMLLKDMDWLSGGARPGLTTEGGRVLADLPKLSKQRKRNRGRTRGLWDKKKAAALSADVVALQSAMLLIQDHGYGHRKGNI